MDYKRIRLLVAQLANYLLIAWVTCLSALLFVVPLYSMDGTTPAWANQSFDICVGLLRYSYTIFPVLMICTKYSFFKKAVIELVIAIWLLAIGVMGAYLAEIMHVKGSYSERGEGFAFLWGFLIVWCLIMAGFFFVIAIVIRVLRNKKQSASV